MNKSCCAFTVVQLIEALQAFPKDTPVVVSGYEGGYENIQPLLLRRLQHHPQNPYWDGAFQEVKAESEDSFDAVLLSREVRNG